MRERSRIAVLVPALPAALPVIFGGLKTSATIAATPAIVAEFVGANKGLGYQLLQATYRECLVGRSCG